MLVPTVIMALLAAVLLFLAYQKGGGVYVLGLKNGANTFLQIVPLLMFAMIVAGTLPLLVPRDVISRWVGAESGLRGIMIGSFVGGLMPGGPFISLPLAAGLLQVGVGVGTMVAMLTGWSVLAFLRLPMEIGIMGWRFTAIRLACTFFFPPIAGLVANRLFARVTLL